MFKNILGFLAFSIILNVVGYYYIFSELEIPQTTSKTVVELPDAEPLYSRDSTVVDMGELDCLARNIYHEARNQSLHGQKAVAFVTLNRVKHVDYPNSICEVVYQPSQFSWTFQNRSVNLDNVVERRAWENSKQIAFDVMTGKAYNNLYGVTHYHAHYVSPNWGFQQVAVIDDHIFYTGALSY